MKEPTTTATTATTATTNQVSAALANLGQASVGMRPQDVLIQLNALINYMKFQIEQTDESSLGKLCFLTEMHNKLKEVRENLREKGADLISSAACAHFSMSSKQAQGFSPRLVKA